MENLESILLREYHSLGVKFESQFIRRWIIKHFAEILHSKNFSEGFCQNVCGDRIEFKKLYISIQSAVWRDDANLRRDQILDAINSTAREKFGSRESIVEEIIFHGRKLNRKKIENRIRNPNLDSKKLREIQSRLQIQESIRREIRRFLRQKPWAIYSEVFNSISQKFPSDLCTPQIVNRSRIELIQILSRKLTIEDQNHPDAKILTMLKLQLPPDRIDSAKINRVFHELRFDLAQK